MCVCVYLEREREIGRESETGVKRVERKWKTERKKAQKRQRKSEEERGNMRKWVKETEWKWKEGKERKHGNRNVIRLSSKNRRNILKSEERKKLWNEIFLKLKTSCFILIWQ